MDTENAWWTTKKSMGLTVILAGLATSAITLGIVHLVGQADILIMGFYVAGVFPIGAILAGLAAGSGYGIAIFRKGIRVAAAVCVVIVVLQVACYAVAEYLDYRAADPTYEDGTPVGFVEYFDHVTRSYYWKGSSSGDEPGEPLGAWGYGLRALEVAGFAFGGLVWAIIAAAAPYCDACQLYMKKRTLVAIPAAASVKGVPKADRQAVQEDAWSKAMKELESLQDLAKAGKHQEFTRRLAELSPPGKAAGKKLPLKIQVEGVWCKQCGKGYLKASRVVQKGNSTTTTDLSKTEITPEFVKAVPGFEIKGETLS